ncbi:hypothetical protein N9F34_01305 [Alphaproteobacteria bacterium]|nr:hypothetical protein [Alphaproteobacteria bacterium]
MSDDTPIYLLVEESFRELEARVSIGAHCVSKGRRVVIGQQWWFFENAHRLPHGIMLFKGNNCVQAKAMAATKAFGHKVASIEEEAFGLVNQDIERLFSDNIVGICDLFLAQGEVQRDYLIHQRGASPGQVAVTGNPRIDLLQAPFRARSGTRVEKLRKEHGAFVLINTNFAQINPHDYDCLNYYDRCLAAGTYKSDEPDDLAKFHYMMRWERTNFEAVVAFIRDLKIALSELKVIIRPHPSECVGRWQAAYDLDPNVHVVQDSDYISWVRAATVVVHTSCTTGLEAFFLDAKAISLTPGNAELNTSFLSNIANPVCKEPTAAVQIISNLLIHDDQSPWSPDKFSSTLRPHIQFSVDRSAAARVADAIEKIRWKKPAAPSRDFTPRLTDPSAARSERRAMKMSITPANFQDLWREITGLLKIDTAVDIQAIGPSVSLITPLDVRR